ncbi:MAG TPA: RDD family protein [Leucothrix mucor]|uniref:RDD family protein n=1 Tax=Leucothrix mucor TaxID=45248 RepID=A0A7V2T2Y8_LEUMU|nr:RDD family protein [Leucothrix mucor]
MAQIKSLDTLYTVNTPEGINLTLSPAGPMPRMLAWVIDVLIRFVIYTVTFTVLAILGSSGTGIALIITFLVEWFYPVYFELFKNGQTPGKKSLNLYVVQDNGSPVTPAASMIRNLLRFVDFLPLFYGFGLASMLLNKRFQRLGDLVAGTVVLYKEEPLIEDLMESDEIDHHAIVPPMSLKIEEQQTILQFRQRQLSLSKDRAEELAGLSGVLVADAKAGEKTVYLTRLGNWIAGKR